MRVLTWNIRHGGQSRVDRIAAELKERGPDVVALTEFRTSNAKLTAALAELGYTHTCIPSCEPNKNSVILAARKPLEGIRLDSVPVEHEHRVVAAQIGAIDIVAMYFPQKEAKVPLFNWLEAQTRAFSKRPTLVVGDLNTGLHRVDEAKATFYAVKEFEKLTQVGWTDLWRSRYPEGREYSWFSAPPHNNGFRVDHAFGNATLDSRVEAVRYEHACRERGDSDHSALVVDIREYQVGRCISQ